MSLALDRHRLSCLSVTCAAAASLLAVSLGYGPSRAWAAAAATKADNSDKSKELPKPKEIDLTTSDELDLKATYFPGTKGQDSIPVIIIHGLGPKSNRKEFAQDDGLARFLQSNLGCAVIVPDLRGHGESKEWTEELQKRLRDQHKRAKAKLEAEKLTPKDRIAMLDEDLMAVKDYLWKKNNEKELNLDKLAVIGVEDGAALALMYAGADAGGYGRGAYYGQSLKLGDFVKALVLVSPQYARVSGVNTAQVLHDPRFRDLRRDLSVMILVGDQSNTYYNEAKSLHALFEGGRPKLDRNSKPEDMTLWFYDKGKTPTTLQGVKLLAEPTLKAPAKIAMFLDYRLVKNPDGDAWVWKQRKLPHE